MTTTALYQVSLLPDWRSSTLPFTRPPKDLSKTQTLPWLCITRRRKLGLFMVLIPADLFRLNASTCSTHTLQIPNFSGAFWRSAPDGHQTTLGKTGLLSLPPGLPLFGLGICWPALQDCGIIYYSLSKSFLIRTHFQTVSMKSNRWLKTLQDGLVCHMNRQKKKQKNTFLIEI